MKKLLTLLLAVLLVLSLCACGGGGSAGSKLDGMTLEDIGKKVTEGISVTDTMAMELDSEWFPYMAFTDYIDGCEAMSFDAMKSAVAHSVVLVKVPAGTDVQKVAADMEANADPAKWICVVADKVVVKYSGNVILLAMTNEADAKLISDNFDALTK